MMTKTKPVPICSEHQVPKEWRKTTFDYTDQGITVHVPGVYAWVCPVDGEASFLPETVDELIATVREQKDSKTAWEHYEALAEALRQAWPKDKKTQELIDEIRQS